MAVKEKRRTDTIMQTNVMALTEDDINDIIAYFTSRPPVQGSFRLDPDKVANWASKARALKCADCHMANYSGGKEAPRLTGMEPQYTAYQIDAFVKGERLHPWITPESGISYEDAADLGQFFAQIK